MNFVRSIARSLALAVLVMAFALLGALAFPRDASAQVNETPPELDHVDVVEHLGGRLPLDAQFRDSEGKSVHLADYFDGKRPVVLVFAYHTCPMLCSLVLDATVQGLRAIPWTAGNQYDVLSISIDPRDTPETAEKKRSQVAGKYGPRDGAVEPSEHGFHFLVGDEANIKRASDAVGFEFKYDERQGQYAHPAAIYLVTPDARIARYLYGISFDPKDLRLGLLEASEGRLISSVERLLLYCYHYDPQGKHYAIVAMRVMRIGGVITMFLLGGLLGLLWLRERKRPRTRSTPSFPPSPGPGLPPRGAAGGSAPTGNPTASTNAT